MTTEPTKKGRPTPKRKDVEATRKISSLAPASSKAEKARQKEASRAARVAQREAQLRGDESALLPRDRGPEKRFVRNFVDSRRGLAEFLMPATFAVLVLSIFQIPALTAFGTILMYTLLFYSIGEALLLNRRIKVEFAKRFPSAVYKGYGFYILTRTISLRRIRVPRPQVKPGEKI
jgi:hypothetical protein